MNALNTKKVQNLEVESAPSFSVFLEKDTFNKLGYKAKINTHTTSYIN